MYKIEIISYGDIKYKPYKMVAIDFIKRLKPYCKISENRLKPKEKNKKISEKDLEKHLKNKEKSSIFLLSEEGKLLNSNNFSSWLKEKKSQDITFVIADALGFCDKLKEKYQLISLSKLTFPHELAYIILLEQIYRSITIEIGKTYHY